MGFAAGLNAGKGLVQSVIDNERQSRLDARAEEEYARKKRIEGEQDTEHANIPRYALNPVTPTAAPNAPPTSVAATAGTGAPPVEPARPAAEGGAPALPGGAQPTVAAGLQAPTQPAGGTAGVAAVAPQAPSAATGQPAARAEPAPALSEDMNMARAQFNYARAMRDVNGMNTAREQIRTVAKRDYVNQAGKLNEDEAYKYVHQNLTMAGGMPISIARQGKDGYTMMSWDEAGDSRVTKLNGAQIKQLVAADMLMKNGFADEGLTLAAGIHKDLNDLIGKMNQSTQGQAQVNNQAAQGRETGRHNRATEANAAARLAMDSQKNKDAAAREKAGDYNPVGINPDGKSIRVWDSKLNRMADVPVAEGVDPQEQFKMMRLAQGGKEGSAGIKMNADGSFVDNGKLYIPNPDPKSKQTHIPANYGPSKLDTAIEADLKGKGGAPAAGGFAGPGGGSATQQPVPGRPLYYADQRELQRMASKPRGISTAEANDAAAELQQRQGESRIQGL